MCGQGSAVDNPDEAMTRPPKDDAPFSALAFKIMADQFVGSLTFLRIYRSAEAQACVSAVVTGQALRLGTGAQRHSGGGHVCAVRQ